MKTIKGYLSILKIVMAHNQYGEEMTTTKECDKLERWTPTDLILREYLNNGGGSSEGFLGITKSKCFEAVEFIKEHLEELIAKDFISEKGWNNFGIPLWDNYFRSRG